jgi:hypothetical protein
MPNEKKKYATEYTSELVGPALITYVNGKATGTITLGPGGIAVSVEAGLFVPAARMLKLADPTLVSYFVPAGMVDEARSLKP